MLHIMKKYLILFIAALVASLAACSDDPTDMGSVDGPGAESAVLRLSIPGAEEVAVYSAGSDSETRIQTLYLFIFRSGTLVWAETHVAASSQHIVGNGTSQVTVSFSGGTVPQAGDKVYVIANPPTFTGPGMTGSLNTSVRGSLQSIYVGSSITETQFLEEQLAGDNPFLNTSASGFTPDGMYSSGMPMFGSVEWQGTGSNICTLVRTVAKVRIVDIMGNDIASLFPGKTVEYGFAGTPTGVGIGVGYNATPQKYEPLSLSSGQRAVARWGSVPTGGASTVGYVATTRPLYPWSWLSATKVPVTVGGALSSPATIPSNDFDQRRCALMLRVTDIATGGTEFYRLDFARQTRETSFTQDAEYEYMDIDPNTSYTFRVERVLSQGYATEAEAWQNAGSNLEFTLDVINVPPVGSNPGLGYVVSNGQYGLCFSEKAVQVRNDEPSGHVLMRYSGVVNTSTAPQLTNRTIALVGADKKTLIPYSQVEFAENSTPSWSNLVDVSSFPFTNIRDIMIQTAPSGSPTPNPLPSGGMYLRFVAGNITEYIPVKCNTFRVTSSGTTLSSSGGISSFTVTSYSGNEGTDSPEPWTVEYSVDNGPWTPTAPSWLTAPQAGGTDPVFPSNGGSGSLTAQSFTAAVPSNPRRYFNTHADALKATTPVSDYDLSTNGGMTAQNTANCYVVNAPGTYRLPLVYGNARKNNNNNTSAYQSSASGSNILPVFFDHRGMGITQPYIDDQYTPGDCCLVWQDAYELVTNVRLSSTQPDGHRYLEFEVPQATITQGNAVVAVREAGTNRIMWSWHIWVTDYQLGTGLQTTTNYQGVTYKFLPWNIGWCDQASYTSPARSVRVHITQTATGLQEEFTITQDASSTAAAVSGNNPYFQWGRKDPMIPGIIGGPNKDFYNGDGYTWGVSDLGANIAKYIQEPHSFNTYAHMDNKYYNLWSANNTVDTANDNPVVKTVYDPSPVGFCMPPSNAWTGFTTTGNNTSIASQIRGTWDSTVSPAGYNFDITGGTAYYPALGYRNFSSGALYNVDSNGYCWSAGPYSPNVGRYFGFSAGDVDLLVLAPRSFGFPVRPVQE